MGAHIMPKRQALVKYLRIQKWSKSGPRHLVWQILLKEQEFATTTSMILRISTLGSTIKSEKVMQPPQKNWWVKKVGNNVEKKKKVSQFWVQTTFCKSIQNHNWKSPNMSHLSFPILAFSTNFCPIKTDLSGNTVWPKAPDFQKLAKMDHFWHF